MEDSAGVKQQIQIANSATPDPATDPAPMFFWLDKENRVFKTIDPLDKGLNNTRVIVTLTAKYLKDTQTKSGCYVDNAEEQADYKKYGVITTTYAMHMLFTDTCVQYTITEKLSKTFDKTAGLSSSLQLNAFGGLDLSNNKFYIDVSEGLLTGFQKCVGQDDLWYQIVGNQDGAPI